MVFLIIGMRVVLMFVGLLTRRYIPADVLGTLSLSLTNHHQFSFSSAATPFWGKCPSLGGVRNRVYSHFGELVMY